MGALVDDTPPRLKARARNSQCIIENYQHVSWAGYLRVPPRRLPSPKNTRDDRD